VRGEEDSNQCGKENQREYLSEVFNFSCVLRGDVKYLEKIKDFRRWYNGRGIFRG